MRQTIIRTASPDLIREAARRRGWHEVLRQLGLAATDVNIREFRIRALEIGADVRHLRRRRGLESVPADVLRAAVDGATSQVQVIARLGLRPGGNTYAALARAAQAHDITLPARRPHGVGRSPRALARSDAEVEAAFRSARSIADLLRLLGLVPRGDNYRVIKRRLSAMGLDPAQLPGQAWARGGRLPRTPIEEMLVRGRPCSGSNLAKRLIDALLLPRACALCGGEEWQGQPIPIELDHINGDHTDNRLENLRLLCPNCHALTDTYRGRNIARRRSLTVSPEC